MWLTPIVALALVAQPPGDHPSRPAAEAAEDALRHWEAGRFDDARKSIARAYMIEPWRQYLYARAQIERADKQCKAAIEFYQLYLDEAPPEDAAVLAKQGIAECERELASAPQSPSESPADTPPDRPARPWYRDPLGMTFVTTGGASLLVGAGMFGLVATRRRAAEQSDDHDQFGDRIHRAERASVAAVALVSIGAALLTAGVIRLAVQQSKSRRRARSARWSVDASMLTLRW
ncbi:MAG TPA: hypothetical protein VG755_33115 [Nannocystaceae bacterium]|nr:hypothetical protein [Nannocystaceae bacterium]